MRRKMRLMGATAGLLLTALVPGAVPLCAQSASARSAGGSLMGTIHDQAGLRLSNADVRVRNAGTSLETATRTNQNGEYRFEYLAPGKYSIRASANGATTVQINDVALQVNKIATINVTLPDLHSGPISVFQVSEAPEPVDAPLPVPREASDDAKTMDDPKIVGGEINAMRDRLALSADQQAKIHAIFLERQMQIAAIRADTILTPSVRRERIKAARLDADIRFRALLNENQIDEYEEILRERRERALQHKPESVAANSPQ